MGIYSELDPGLNNEVFMSLFHLPAYVPAVTVTFRIWPVFCEKCSFYSPKPNAISIFFWHPYFFVAENLSLS